ncbi:Speckle-type POZ protein-like B like protein [Argiope bruennichi]|uniref:Speckle-type POZ protein-like B like protein n=1 Tax=Argiope bruennichi TaxID=94029 RepID=A0A8T0EE62_ARGBR|nr:Speckle-type POZ protein-like B like protein [Argiope bruennichi]
MANSGLNSSTQFTFIWLIENYRQPPFLKLQSPTFTVDSIEKTKWCLVLHVNQHCVLCYIKRQMDRSALKSMGLDFELAILTADGTLVNGQRNIIFHINPHSKIIKLIENSVLCERKAEFLPNNTLTIRCQIRRRDIGIVRDLCFARTQLRDEGLSFIWAVENFSLLLLGHKINYTLQHCGFTLNLILYLEQDDDMLHIEIHALGGRYCSIKYKISAMDTKGKIIHSVENGCRLHLNEEIISFQLLIGKKELMANKDLYLLNDILILRCEFDIFGGTNSNRIEYSLQSFCPDDARKENNCNIDENSTSNADARCLLRNPNADDHAMSENNYTTNEDSISCNDYCSLKKTLKFVGEEMIFSDIILRTGLQLFPAHKNILIARCPIFKAMLSCDIADGDSSVIDLQNLNGNTLHHLLLYIYTDNLDNLRREYALDLLCVADEYGLTDLKKRCSSYLKADLCMPNISNVLQDETLILSTKDCTSQRKRNNTEIWNIFQKCRKRMNKGNN